MYLFVLYFLLCLLPVCSVGEKALADSSHSAEARYGRAGAELETFFHPDTGEILTHEQWQNLGIQDEQSGGAVLGETGSPQPQDSPPVLNGRLVELEDGDYIIVVDVPEDERRKTEVHFDEQGKPHMKCIHKTH